MKHFSRRSFLQNLSMGIGTAATIPVLSPHLKVPGIKHENFDGRKLNIALCGLGRYANILADGFASSQYCALSGIVTGTPRKAVEWKKRFNIPDQNIYNYENFDMIKNNKDIDLVYIVLPNAMHKEFVIRSAKAGKHVITEKPMANSVKDCEEMIKICRNAGVQLAVGYRLHYEPYHLEIKRLGQQKIFGQIKYIEASLCYKSSDPNEWRIKKAMSGGGPLMNIGIYCVQCSRYVLGEEPIAVTAQFGPVTDKNLFSEVEESITWQLVFPGGAVCTSTSSYNCFMDRFYAAADDGFIEMSPALSYGPFKGRTSNGELNYPTINQQTTQLDEIAKLILDNKPLPDHITGEEGLKDMKVIEAIYEAARSGKRVSIV